MYKTVTPVTPPYEYSKSYSDIYEDYMFRRVSSMPSPAEIDSEEETASDTSSASISIISSSSIKSNHNNHSSPIIMQKSRKSVPHRSPSNMVDQKSVVFQIEQDFPKIVAGGHGGVLWSLRQRVSMARRKDKNRLSAPLPNRRVRAMRIQIPRPQWSNPIYDDLVSPTPQSQSPLAAPESPQSLPVKIIPVIIPLTQEKEVSVTKPQKVRKNSHATSGRPSRVKGPCQACHETSDGCMRKAFHWPFPTSTIFNDKGKPFVYLCNKCGLRYNKSGGCVCRHCRWVLCKEEKRKAMQLIDQMRRSRPDGRIDPDEDIQNFSCSPKYWSCGRPWKVGWVLHSQHDDEDEDMLSPSLSEATL
ncbi:uncharacterized protein EV154DRAFT_498301 [Mucor mucedo]|uniref:uncharacterized protein n=1 Tax=Mucor mucedo TaxID=29922 RepID=UPI0022207BEB|nr:uncharacterized protein EV154DRAFT_498301 [Mucor mucedo]KAI7894605.1 hypothetical protein EV154DRAFT_498301 [Mucor mucedo]